ncbi:MAG TPA: cytochrome c biogenesis protein CcdA [Gemmatimonadaceae bacterium]|nr:cytochrome c biogenesis protein CcdA [Gemmatimonadaceae bacterium]
MIQAPAGISPAFLWLAATAGALSLLTPCVFPMVPITVSYFLRHAQTSRARAFTAIAIFGLGIIVTFTALGVTVAALVGAAGLTRFAANAWVNLAIAAIFLALALNLLGFYQLNVSSRVLNDIASVTRGRNESDATSTLLMGVLFTLTSFTCTAPFIGTLLVAASQGEWQRPIVGMLVYAIVFALPFIVLATVPRWINSLPSSGAWLNRVKVVMGFVEIAAVAKFISNADLVWHWNIFTHDVVLAIWVALALIATFYLLGAFRLPHEPQLARSEATGASQRALPHIGASQAIPALVFLALGMWLATGLTGSTLGTLESFLPPVGGAPASVNAADVPAELHWRLNDLPAALAVARQENRRVFIDFTGYTCTNCRWMEANMFTRPEIKVAMNRFVLARLYTDGDGDMYDRQQQMQQQRFGTIALPLYAIVDPDGKTLTTFAGLTRSPNDFLSFLSAGLN